MIFTATELNLIRKGTKTQHAIPVRRHRTTHTPDGILKPPVKPCHIRPGHNYIAHVAPGKPGVRIDILHVQRATLADIDPPAHGYPTLEAFRDDWKQRHRLKPDRPLNWRREVWIVAFKTLDATIYLAKGTVQDDYTMRPELAVITEAVTDPHAYELLEARHIEAPTRPLHERVATAITTAQGAGVDTHRYEQKITRELEALEARARRRAA